MSKDWVWEKFVVGQPGVVASRRVTPTILGIMVAHGLLWSYIEDQLYPYEVIWMRPSYQSSYVYSVRRSQHEVHPGMSPFILCSRGQTEDEKVAAETFVREVSGGKG